MAMTKPRDGLSGVIYISLTLLGWASVPLFLKYFTNHFDAWTANGWRYGISAVFWGPVVIVAAFRHSLPPGLWRAAIVPSVMNAIGQALFAWAPYYIDPGLMTFMLRFNVIFIAFGAYILFPAERYVLRSPMFWSGLIIVFLGLIDVFLMGRGERSSATAFGVGLVVLSGLFYAAYSLSVRHYLHGMHPVIAFGAISSYTALALVPLMIVFGDANGRAVFSLSAFQWFLLITSAMVGIALGHVFYYAAIARLGVAVAAGVVMLQPIFAGTGSYFLFGEHLSMGQWINGVAAIGGAILMLVAQQRARPPLVHAERTDLATGNTPQALAEVEAAGT